MSIVLIDMGNTRVKMGWVDPRSGRRESQAMSLDAGDVPALAHWLAELPSAPLQAWAANVAGPAAAQALQRSMDQALAARGLPPLDMHWVTSAEQALDVAYAYLPPESLGVDRWAAMLGLASHESEADPHTRADAGRPCAMLASFGTATTIDTLAPQDDAPYRFVHRGGLILPGPSLMRASLARGTAGLPEAQGQVVAQPVDTHTAITSGIAAAQAGALARQWLAVRQAHGRAPRVYVCGGGWEQVQDEAQRLLTSLCSLTGEADVAVRLLPAPVLDGLARLALNDGIAASYRRA